MSWQTKIRRSGGNGLQGAVTALVLAAALMAVGACSSDDCADCTQGCCRDGECVLLLNQNDNQCGFGGAECTDCAASAMTCDSTQGVCSNGGTSLVPGVNTPITSNPPITSGCANCVGGCCDGATGQCLLEGQPCSMSGTTCRAGICQLDTTDPGPNPPLTTQCPGGCPQSFECLQGRCVGPVERCQQSCGGCCTDQGKCNALGSSQSDYACGTGGQMCLDCSRSGQVCNEQRGGCEFGSPGDWEICVISAKVSGQYSECSPASNDDNDNAPDMYVEFRVGGIHKETAQTAGRREGGDWVGAWVSDRACVRVPGDVADNDGVTVVVKDADWGWGACQWGDFTDDNLGDCTLYTDRIRPGDSFVRLGSSDCRLDLMELELKFTAFPSSR